MLWGGGSSMTSRNGWGGSDRESTVRLTTTSSPVPVVATISTTLTPGFKSVSALKPPLTSTVAGTPFTVTDAPGSVRP